jgi:flagellar biosynthesis protein FlhF
MQQFTIQAPTASEAFEKMRRLYGDDAVILSHREVRIGGVMGLFARRGVEIAGYTRRRSQLQPRAMQENLAPEELERRKNDILDAIRRISSGCIRAAREWIALAQHEILLSSTGSA